MKSGEGMHTLQGRLQATVTNDSNSCTISKAKQDTGNNFSIWNECKLKEYAKAVKKE